MNTPDKQAKCQKWRACLDDGVVIRHFISRHGLPKGPGAVVVEHVGERVQHEALQVDGGGIVHPPVEQQLEGRGTLCLGRPARLLDACNVKGVGVGSREGAWAGGVIGGMAMMSGYGWGLGFRV